MNKMIQESLRLLYNSEISPEEAEYRVSCEDPKELSRFIVDAFNRGWISCRNLGFNEDGEYM